MTDLPTRRIAILGGGITGLAAALRLRERMPEARWDLFESGDSLGGVLGTERVDGFLVERGADMISAIEPWAISLCKRIGFEDELIGTDDRHRRAFIVRAGKLFPVPDGFTLLQPRKLVPVMRSRLLSWRGKFRLLREVFVAPRKATSDESLADFTIRRFGREVFERLVQPLVGGVYTADPYRLSMAATLDRFARMEREQGGLIRAVLADMFRSKRPAPSNQGSGARYGMFVTPREGMSSLIDAIASRLPSESVHLRHFVRGMAATPDGGWTLTVEPKGGDRFQATYHGVIIALPANAAARVLDSVDRELVDQLGKIPFASSAVITLGARRDQIDHPLDGFGLVAPLTEERQLLAASFSSVKFAGRAPPDHVLLRVFMGGACQPDLLEHDDEGLLGLARSELGELLGFRGAPCLERVTRWEHTMPQYHVGHLAIVDAIERCAARLPNLALAGNSYRGVGLPFCIRGGEAAADKIASQLYPPNPPS